jgi:hypothetical protein
MSALASPLWCSPFGPESIPYGAGAIWNNSCQVSANAGICSSVCFGTMMVVPLTVMVPPPEKPSTSGASVAPSMNPTMSNGAAPFLTVCACGATVMLTASATTTAAIRQTLERIAVISFNPVVTLVTAGTA